MNRPKVIVKKKVRVISKQFYRPMLENLEERCLLSGGFAQVILASDVPGLAPLTDPNLINPWGLSFSPTGPFWIAENGSNVSDVLDGRGQLIPLVVTIPSAGQSGGTPTGTVFNASPGFVISEDGVSAPSRFLFANEDGTVAGWSGKVSPTSAILAVDNSSSGAVYTGLALAGGPSGNSFLYAADFSHGTVDVFDQEFRPILRPNAFQDLSLPTGFAPFNIQKIANLLFVTYAQQGENLPGTVSVAGLGFIDVYNPDGSLVSRFASQGNLNSPWGLALAPEGFGQFGGALLVGNNGDGQISAYDPKSGTFLGELRDQNSLPIAIPNLWALIFGNDHAGGNSNTLFFAAGTEGDEHGLFGAIQAPGREGSETAGSGIFELHGPGEPGDYPLPPSGGPVIRAREDQLLPIADLLPLKESSLLFVPTLSNISPPVLSAETPSSSTVVNAGFFAGPFTADTAFVATRPQSSEEISQLGRVVSNDARPLFAFLDLDVTQVNGRADPTAFAFPSKAFANRNAGLSAFSAISSQGQGRLLTKVDLSDRLSLPSEGNEKSGEAQGEMSVSAAEERVTKLDSGEGRKGVLWTNLFRFVFAFSIPIIWGHWLHTQRNRNRRDTVNPKH